MWKIWVNIKKASWISQYLNICETGMKNWFCFDCGINILTTENLTIYDNPLNTEHFYKITLPNCGKYMFIDAYFNSLDALETSIQKASSFLVFVCETQKNTSALIISIMHEMRCSPQMSSPNALSIYREQNAIRAVFKWAFPASSFSIMSEGTTDHLDVAVFAETQTRACCAPAWLCVYILATELQEQLSPSTPN